MCMMSCGYSGPIACNVFGISPLHTWHVCISVQCLLKANASHFGGKSKWLYWPCSHFKAASLIHATQNAVGRMYQKGICTKERGFPYTVVPFCMLTKVYFCDVWSSLCGHMQHTHTHTHIYIIYIAVDINFQQYYNSPCAFKKLHTQAHTKCLFWIQISKLGPWWNLTAVLRSLPWKANPSGIKVASFS